MIIEVIEKVIDILSNDERLEGKYKSIGYGAVPQPVSFAEFPLIFITVANTRYPETRAAFAHESSYLVEINLTISVYSYFAEDTVSAFTEVCELYENIVRILHENKKVDNLAISSEIGEETIDWGILPWGDLADEYAFGVSIPYKVIAISQ